MFGIISLFTTEYEIILLTKICKNHNGVFDRDIFSAIF